MTNYCEAYEWTEVEYDTNSVSTGLCEQRRETPKVKWFVIHLKKFQLEAMFDCLPNGESQFVPASGNFLCL